MKKVLAFFNNRSSYVAVSLFFLMCVQILGSAHANAADSQLRAEIGSNLSYVILQNSQIYVKYLPFNEGHTQFAIREFRIKSAGNENQAGRYLEAATGKANLASASIIDNGTAKKTVRLVWNTWIKSTQTIDTSKKLTQEVSIFPNSKHLKIVSVNVKYGLNIVDIGTPGGTTNGKHFAYGHGSWGRAYITHKDPSYHGSYYNRYPPDGVNDPANGGALNYHNHFIFGVYNPSNGRGFARTIPVSACSIAKLLLSSTQRNGLELYPYPFNKDHPQFTSYLFAVTGGESDILSTGKALADGIPDCNDDCDNLLDTDGDGVPDGQDLCPNDPNKIQPGICGCNIADTDSDSDGIPDCNDDCDNLLDTDGDGTSDCDDLCPNDPNKINPGICGCGVADADSDGDGNPDCNDDCDNLIDTDGDGTNDCDDLCPNDPQKIGPGICGCGLPDTDSDGDGTLDCQYTNDDNDGLPDGEERGLDGNEPNYDGNHDGIADRLQDNVTSLHSYDGQYYITIESPTGTSISNCNAADNPSSTNAPSDMEFSYGFFGFTITDISNGSATTVTLHFPVGTTFGTYYKYGPTPNNPTNHWYEFLYDGQTGAEIIGNIITLHFVDGTRGDDDLIANGIVVDDGAPAVVAATGGGTTVTSDGGGGGGCFIATAAYGSLMEPHVKILRDFRDKCLLNNSLGKGLVQSYYTYSPSIANFISKHDNLRAVVRVGLLPVVGISWIALKIGTLSTVALMFLFISCFVGLVWFRRRYKE